MVKFRNTRFPLPHICEYANCMKNDFSFCSVSHGGQLQQGKGEKVFIQFTIKYMYSTIRFNINFLGIYC